MKKSAIEGGGTGSLFLSLFICTLNFGADRAARDEARRHRREIECMTETGSFQTGEGKLPARQGGIPVDFTHERAPDIVERHLTSSPDEK